jgi:hypothetical protein
MSAALVPSIEPTTLAQISCEKKEQPQRLKFGGGPSFAAISASRNRCKA